LAYLASGPYKKEYELLPVDRVFLVDYHCFPALKKYRKSIRMSSYTKVTCLGMDALDAIDFFKKNDIRIDILVIINEGLSEGGGYMALNTNSVLSYILPIMNEEYIHILNPEYYNKEIKINLDLPVEKRLLSEKDAGWINPTIFSEDWGRNAEVFRVKKKPSEIEVNLNPNIRTFVIHDSIWNYHNKLDLIVLSIKEPERRYFFGIKNKVMTVWDLPRQDLFAYCDRNKIENIGFTPWGRNRYSSFIDFIKGYKGKFPKRISLFHLNNDDYTVFRKLH
jgi:hypothetical protein